MQKHSFPLNEKQRRNLALLFSPKRDGQFNYFDFTQYFIASPSSTRAESNVFSRSSFTIQSKVRSEEHLSLPSRLFVSATLELFTRNDRHGSLSYSKPSEFETLLMRHESKSPLRLVSKQIPEHRTNVSNHGSTTGRFSRSNSIQRPVETVWHRSEQRRTLPFDVRSRSEPRRKNFLRWTLSCLDCGSSPCRCTLIHFVARPSIELVQSARTERNRWIDDDSLMHIIFVPFALMTFSRHIERAASVDISCHDEFEFGKRDERSFLSPWKLVLFGWHEWNTTSNKHVGVFFSLDDNRRTDLVLFSQSSAMPDVNVHRVRDHRNHHLLDHHHRHGHDHVLGLDLDLKKNE